jgi:Acetyltransferase (GNAT) family
LRRAQSRRRTLGTMGRHELWVELADRPGNLAAVAADLAACGANIVHLDVHAGGDATVIDRLVVQVPDERSHELAEAAARCGATLLHLDDADPHALVDDVVRALDVATALATAARPGRLAEAIGRLIPADEVRIEALAESSLAGTPLAGPLAHGVTTIERAGNPAGDDDAAGERPWLLLVPHDHADGPGVAVLRRVGPRFTATEAARCRALLRLAGRLTAGGHPADPPPDEPAAVPRRRPPTALERLIVLPDGGIVRLRHVGSGDRDALVDHHARCSEPTRRRSSLFTPEPPAPAGVADGPAHTDGRHHVALAALVGNDIVGLARYDLDPGGPDAEIAVVVEDRQQCRGIGTLLVAELASLASQGDVRRLRAVTHPGDEALARTFRRAGLGFRSRPQGDVTVLECGCRTT